jgi:hypothetical protein
VRKENPMSEHSIEAPMDDDMGVEGQPAGPEFFGEHEERESGDEFIGEHGERVHEGRHNESQEATEEPPLF